MSEPKEPNRLPHFSAERYAALMAADEYAWALATALTTSAETIERLERYDHWLSVMLKRKWDGQDLVHVWPNHP